MEPEKREKLRPRFLWNGIKSKRSIPPTPSDSIFLLPIIRHGPEHDRRDLGSGSIPSVPTCLCPFPPYPALRQCDHHHAPLRALHPSPLSVLPLCRSIYQHIPDPPSVTTQYHYPLAPLNYCLQFLSIILVLTSVLIKCVIILNACGDQGDVWPYDLIYVAVTIPPTTWSMGRDAAWFLLQALNMGLANVGVSGNINPDTLTWVARSRMSNS